MWLLLTLHWFFFLSFSTHTENSQFSFIHICVYISMPQLWNILHGIVPNIQGPTSCLGAPLSICTLIAQNEVLNCLFIYKTHTHFKSCNQLANSPMLFGHPKWFTKTNHLRLVSAKHLHNKTPIEHNWWKSKTLSFFSFFFLPYLFQRHKNHFSQGANTLAFCHSELFPKCKGFFSTCAEITKVVCVREAVFAHRIIPP